MEGLDDLRGEVFHLYIGEGMRLEDVMKHLKQRHDLNVTYVRIQPIR